MREKEQQNQRENIIRDRENKTREREDMREKRG